MLTINNRQILLSINKASKNKVFFFHTDQKLFNKKLLYKSIKSFRTINEPKIYFYSTTSKNDKTDSIDSANKSKKFIRIGDTIREVKNVQSKEKELSKIPIGFLENEILCKSKAYLSHLRWFMQKDSLRQDCFLIGSPPGAFRRRLAMSYAEMMKRQVEYLCITRDTTESDMKQRREIVSSSVEYVNQCAVNAAISGRILIIEGIEKAERNLLPILNNLLENREMNLDDGSFLVSPERYDKLVELAKKEEELVCLLI